MRLKILALMLLMLSLESAFGYTIFVAKTYRCQNGQVLGILLQTVVGVRAEANPKYRANSYCKSTTLVGFPFLVTDMDNSPFLRACGSERASEPMKQCFEQEFVPKCVDQNHVVNMSCFPE